MGIFSGTEISNEGLVFAYDMGNTQKSWKGAPTTNLTPDMSIVAVQLASVSFVGIEDGWKKYSLNGTWTAGTYPYSIAVQATSFTGGVTYSTGVYIKTNVPQKFATLFTGMNYVNEPMNNGGTSFSIPQPDGSVFVGRSGFQYTNTTTQTGYLLSQPNVGQTFNSATDFVFIRQGQIEVGAFPTPFVAGTRSNTQALLDLTNNIIPTASSLTYASDNTFSFNGSTDYVTLPSSGIFESSVNYFRASPGYAWSISAWFKFPISPVTSRTGNACYALGGHGGGIGGGETLTLFVGSGTDATYGSYTPYKCAVGIFGAKTILSGSVNTNTWNNIVITWDGSAGRGYFNGVDVGALNIGTAALQTGYSFTVGMVGGVGGALNAVQCFEGSISNFLVYNRALTTVESAINFQALRSRYGI